MEIERAWGQLPGWFESLDDDQQIRLFAWLRVHRAPAGAPKKKNKKRGSP